MKTILIFCRKPQPKRLMTKKDHEARKVQEELEALNRMNERYKKHI